MFQELGQKRGERKHDSKERNKEEAHFVLYELELEGKENVVAGL